MVSTAGCNRKGPSSFPRRAECTQAYRFLYCELQLKTNDGRDRRTNFAVLVVWSDSYALAKTLECERNISSFSFYGQLADCCPHFFSLIHAVDEFSLKEMRTWGQSKISSCCICVWCKSREIGGRGSPRFPTLMVESFSPDLFPAVKVIGQSCYWNYVYCFG